jgi:hypothetical protein
MTSIESLFNKLWEEPKDKLTWNSILEEAKEMHGQEMAQLLQQEISDNSPKEENKTSYSEISDEEIEEEISKRYMHPTQDYAFRDACKWYREQLKQNL